MLRYLEAGALRYVRDQNGVTGIEYGLIGALVSIAIVGGAMLLGVNLGDAYNAVANAL